MQPCLLSYSFHSWGYPRLRMKSFKAPWTYKTLQIVKISCNDSDFYQESGAFLISDEWTDMMTENWGIQLSGHVVGGSGAKSLVWTWALLLMCAGLSKPHCVNFPSYSNNNKKKKNYLTSWWRDTGKEGADHIHGQEERKLGNKALWTKYNLQEHHLFQLDLTSWIFYHLPMPIRLWTNQ